MANDSVKTEEEILAEVETAPELVKDKTYEEQIDETFLKESNDNISDDTEIIDIEW